MFCQDIFLQSWKCKKQRIEEFRYFPLNQFKDLKTRNSGRYFLKKNDDVKIIKSISDALTVPVKNIQAVITLFNEGSTVPFIARYRKELTGSLDETVIQAVKEKYDFFEKLEKRKLYIKEVIGKKDSLTPEIAHNIDKSETLAELEDIYLPYKSGRKTRAKAAKEKGLQGLADAIFFGKVMNPEEEASKYVNAEKGVNSIDEALKGASDIIAEIINENIDVRKQLREFYEKTSLLTSSVIKKKMDEAVKFRDYFDYSEKSSKAAAHRILAVLRGKNSSFLTVKIAVDEEKALSIIKRTALSRNINYTSSCYSFLEASLKDSYSRLLHPSLENEEISALREKADEVSINIFSENLKNLLLESPFGNKAVIAVDPGIRTGSKVVCIDETGKLLDSGVIFLFDDKKRENGVDIIKRFNDKYNIQAAAVGNGTGGREVLGFLKSLPFLSDVPCLLVNESGASVYSASENARREFSDLDLTIRGAVSIGRRLQDPLSELIKIDPRSIGVGQYQHDVNQKKLSSALDDVVVSCVNQVGVDLNSCGPELLNYVSGLNSTLAENIVDYRNKNGKFKNRNELLKVKGMGEKSFQQAAGFLKVKGGDNPLDSSSVHPESYGIVYRIAEDSGEPIEKLIGNREAVLKIRIENYVTEKTGLPTLKDIINELEKPGRDPRKEYEVFSYTEGINSIEDLDAGIVLSGTVTNITAFGAFVDIGVHQDGLVHKSRIADAFVNDPADFLKVNQKVKVKVLEVDKERKRISLSIRDASAG